MEKINCKNCLIKSSAAEALDDNELEMLRENCAEVLLNKGENIIKEGSLSSHIAYLRSGLAKVHKVGPSGRDQILKIVQPGSYMGIQSILFENVHRCSVTALEESSVCYIGSSSFRELIKRSSGFAYEIVVCQSREECNYFTRFVNFAQKQVNGRLADALLFFTDEIYKQHEFKMCLGRKDLASWIGVTRESVARSLREFSDIGVISRDGKSIKIENYELLKKISKSG